MTTFSWLLLLKNDFSAGIVLSIAILKPQLVIPLAFSLALTRRRAFLGFLIGTVSLLVYSLVLVGRSGLLGMLRITSALAAGQFLGGVTQSMMSNATAILVRLGVPAFWSLPIYLGTVVAILVIFKSRGVNHATISLGFVLTVSTSPHLFLYDLAFLVIPLVYVHPYGTTVAAVFTLPLLMPGFWGLAYVLIAGLIYLLAKRVNQYSRTSMLFDDEQIEEDLV